MSKRFEITTIFPLKYLKVILFVVLLVLVFFLLMIGLRKLDLAYNPNAKNHYLAGIIDKMNEVDSIKTPKMILMGGNSMAFGIDSDLLSKELEMPVVNLALDSKLGSNFMINQLESKVQKGDIILITLDYNITSEGDNNTKLLVADFYQPANDWIEYQSFFEPLSAFFARKFTDNNLLINDLWDDKLPNVQDTTSVYFRKAFNKQGDVISHLNNANKLFLPSTLPTEIDFYKQIADLNELDLFAKKRNIKIFFTFASYSENAFETNMIAIQKIEQQFTEKANFKIIGNAHYSVLDNMLFFNNEYNLNFQGRKVFTYRVLQLLEQEKL
jgi:hypothetical protein